FVWSAHRKICRRIFLTLRSWTSLLSRSADSGVNSTFPIINEGRSGVAYHVQARQRRRYETPLVFNFIGSHDQRPFLWPSVTYAEYCKRGSTTDGLCRRDSTHGYYGGLGRVGNLRRTNRGQSFSGECCQQPPGDVDRHRS